MSIFFFKFHYNTFKLQNLVPNNILRENRKGHHTKVQSRGTKCAGDFQLNQQSASVT
jgi:hypothetical protein